MATSFPSSSNAFKSSSSAVSNSFGYTSPSLLPGGSLYTPPTNQGYSAASPGGGGVQYNPGGSYVVFDTSGQGTSYASGTGPQSSYGQNIAAQQKAEEQKRIEDEKRKAELSAMLSPTGKKDVLALGNIRSGNLRTGTLPKSEPTTLFRKQIDTYKGIPTYKLYANESGIVRPASKEEEKYYRQQTSYVSASTLPTSPIQKSQKFQELNLNELQNPPQGFQQILELKKNNMKHCRKKSKHLPKTIKEIQLCVLEASTENSGDILKQVERC